jgi:hypothetical protein
MPIACRFTSVETHPSQNDTGRSSGDRVGRALDRQPNGRCPRASFARALTRARLTVSLVAGSRTTLRARVTEFAYPPVHDALVLGKSAPLGTEAFRKALGLLVSNPFESMSIEDDIVGSILVRSAVLRRMSKEGLVEFVLSHVKPLMTPDEILHLDLQIEVEVGGDNA